MVDAELVDTFYKQWSKLIVEGNAQGMADMYTTDFTMFPPNAPPINGREGM